MRSVSAVWSVMRDVIEVMLRCDMLGEDAVVVVVVNWCCARYLRGCNGLAEMKRRGPGVCSGIGVTLIWVVACITIYLII